MTIRIEAYKTSSTVASAPAPLFRQQPVINLLEHDDAQHLTKNVQIGRTGKFIYHVLDIVNPLAKKHPKFAQFLVKYGEKMIRFSGKV